MRFSELVAEARACGYTEPDPRDDLSGMDVARKLVILGREAGLDLSLDEIAVERLSPLELDCGDIDSFLNNLGAHDETMARRLTAAHDQGRRLRYIASLDFESGRAQVGLQAVAADHPFAHIALTDNIVAFTTERYCDNPLIVQGPGAGPQVTAAGVFADLLRVIDGLGARL